MLDFRQMWGKKFIGATHHKFSDTSTKCERNWNWGNGQIIISQQYVYANVKRRLLKEWLKKTVSHAPILPLVILFSRKCCRNMLFFYMLSMIHCDSPTSHCDHAIKNIIIINLSVTVTTLVTNHANIKPKWCRSSEST